MAYQGSLQLEKYLDEVLPSAKLNIFNRLKKGDKVEIKYDFQNLDRAVADLKIRTRFNSIATFFSNFIAP